MYRAYQKYRVWVINTPVAARLYLWDNWAKLVPGIERLLALTEHPAYIRSFQGYEGENKLLGFGRMRWSEAHNLLWTTKYRDGSAREAELEFLGTQIWAPDWNAHVKTGIAPDIFIQLYNWADVPGIGEGLIIAVPRRLYKKNTMIVDDVIRELRARIPQSTGIMVKRYWKPMWKIANEIQDINPQELKLLIEQSV